ncbi:MAG: hypothetical protein EOP51_06115 [Sphingobacteriales bacterium]|nr:MAG: hypothetical protein EOP51_06115 [Sphingobacteriales bacterium]
MIKTEYTRLRDPDTVLFMDHPDAPFDHLIAVIIDRTQWYRRDGIIRSMASWSAHQFGPRGYRGGRTWTYWKAASGYKQFFVFAQAEQAFAFRLRWHGTNENPPTG